MIDNTINDDKTIAGGGKDAILAGRSLRCLHSFSLMIPIRDAMRHESI